MAKLYPPVIDGAIPAFINKRLTIPFQMNKTVNKNDINGFALLIKDMYGKDVSLNQQIITSAYDLENSLVYFDLSKYDIVMGEYYKVQLAYVDRFNTLGYFSTVGVTKYTSKPVVTIENLQYDIINGLSSSYIGSFTQTEDLSEKLYSSHFCFYDENGELIFETPETIHNSSQDDTTNVQLEPIFVNELFLEQNERLQIAFVATSLNGLVLSTNKYRIANLDTLNSDYDLKIVAKNMYDDGYINVNIQNNSPSDFISGKFLLTRLDVTTNNKITLKHFELNYNYNNVWTYQDFTIEQGHIYKYIIQQYNDKLLYSNPITSNEVIADFEDMFLTDGVRQLKIKFNPKVTSFKENLLESKQETIGSKYPFTFRNPVVRYKEFPIAGLLSHLTDENQFFIEGVKNIRTITDARALEHLIYEYEECGRALETAQVGDKGYLELVNANNIAVSALQELYPNDLHATLKKDSQILRFDSASEDFLAKLKFSTVHLTTDLSGKNFYDERRWKLEVLEWLNNGKAKLFRSAAEGNYLVRLTGVSLAPEEKLGRMLHTFSATAYEIGELNFENLEKYGIIDTAADPITITTWSSWNTQEYAPLENPLALNKDIVLGLSASGFMPGDIIELMFEGSNQYESIMIGSTGSYHIDNVNIVSVRLPTTNSLYGVISYKHYLTSANFAEVDNIVYYPMYLFSELGYKTQDLYYLQSNIKFDIVDLHYINFEKLSIIEVSELPQESDRNCTMIYYIPEDGYYSYEGVKLEDFSLDNCFKIQYNNNVIDLGGQYLDSYTINIPENNNIDLSIGYGIKVNLGLSIKEYIYNIEYDNSELTNLRAIYLNNKNKENYNNYLNGLKKYLKREDEIK